LDDFGAHHGRESARRRGRRERGLAVGALVVAVALIAGFAAAVALSTGSDGNAEAAPPGSSEGAHTAASTGRRATTSTPAPVPRGTVTIAAVGDTMLGNTPTLPPSPGTYLSQMRSALAGDVVFANLEGTLTEATASKCGSAPSSSCFAFHAPPEFARALREAGFTVMSNANNHSFDFGQAGEDQTVRALHRAGIAQTGLPGQITFVRAKGFRIAFLGFAPYPNTASLTDLAAARRLIRRAAARADLVVCAIHAGAEGTSALHLTGGEETYLGEDRGNPQAFAHMAVDAGADLVLGSGPHVLRGMEVYHGRLVAYSLGNFAGYHNFSLDGVLGQSVVLRATLAADGRFRSGRLVSVRLVGAGQPVPDAGGAGATLVGQLSRADLGRRGIRLGPGGTVLR
jgi:poly-gamma-glutamate capsule biosynthesis protein CapA/YwtB (metallophosphatase superfamily)